MKSVLWRVAKRLSYIEDARCPKIKAMAEPDVRKYRAVELSGVRAATGMERHERRHE